MNSVRLGVCLAACAAGLLLAASTASAFGPPNPTDQKIRKVCAQIATLASAQDIETAVDRADANIETVQQIDRRLSADRLTLTSLQHELAEAEGALARAIGRKTEELRRNAAARGQPLDPAKSKALALTQLQNAPEFAAAMDLAERSEQAELAVKADQRKADDAHKLHNGVKVCADQRKQELAGGSQPGCNTDGPVRFANGIDPSCKPGGSQLSGSVEGMYQFIGCHGAAVNLGKSNRFSFVIRQGKIEGFVLVGEGVPHFAGTLSSSGVMNLTSKVGNYDITVSGRFVRIPLSPNPSLEDGQIKLTDPNGAYCQGTM